MSENLSEKKEDSGGFVSFISEHSEKTISADEETEQSGKAISANEEAGGFVSFISEQSGKAISANEETVIEDMLNQGQKTTDNYVHFEDEETPRKSSTDHKHSGFNHGKDRTEEPFNARRNAHYSRFKVSYKASTDNGDLLKREDSIKGKTEAHYAAEEGDLEQLSRMPLDVLNLRDDEGWSPIMYAALAGQLAALQLLQSMGANLKEMDTQGRTLLHIAASFGHEHVITWLLELGFDINATDFYEMTPLHLAAASNQVGATRLLILNWADITCEDDRNRTPLKVAQIAGNPEIIDLLRNTKTD